MPLALEELIGSEGGREARDCRKVEDKGKPRMPRGLGQESPGDTGERLQRGQKAVAT